jgi:hypothetical protein
MITTHQIRSVLKVYGNQLKRRSELEQNSLEGTQQSNDLVDISIEARRKQMVNQMSDNLISQITPKDYKQKADEHNSAGDPLQD